MSNSDNSLQNQRPEHKYFDVRIWNVILKEIGDFN